MALEKAAMKYSNLQITNETIEKELIKYKQAIEQYNIQKHQIHLQQQKQQQIQTFIQQQQNQQQLSPSSNNSMQIQSVKELKIPSVKNGSCNDPEQNLKFTNELKNILHEMKCVLIKCNSQTGLPNGNQNSKENLVDSIDEKSLNEGI